MSSGSHTKNDRTSDWGEAVPRVVEAISWFDRARIRQRRFQMPAFQAEVQAPTSQTDLAGLAEKAARDLYKPTMEARGPHMRTIQEDLAEQAVEGGRGIGHGKHSYETPTTNLTNLEGMSPVGLGNIPLLGKLLGLIRANPRAAQVIATPQRVERGTFVVEVTKTIPQQYTGTYDPTTGQPMFPDKFNTQFWTAEKKVKRPVDLVDLQTPGVLEGDEAQSIDPFTASLLKGADGAMMSPQQILKLHDQLQAGQRTNLKAGPNAEAWMTRVMGGVGEMLKADAARMGAINLVAHLFKVGSLITSALGLAAAAGATGYSMMQINPTNEQINPMQHGYNPYAAATNSDPAAAFSQQTQYEAATDQPQQPMVSPTPAPYQPFGAVNQNFGNLSVPTAPAGGIGAMPSVTPPQQSGASPYGWTRLNSVISRSIFG